MNQNKISKETAILFAFFIVGILTIFRVPFWISLPIVFISAIFLALYSKKTLTPATTTSATPATTTPASTIASAVTILKGINWTVVGVVLAIIILIAGMIYIGDKIMKSDEERREMNVFRIENSTGVSINSGSNYLMVTGGTGGGAITMVSEERNPPCVYFNFSGGNSTFEVSIDGVLYGEAYQFSKPVGVFNTCHYKAKMGDNEKKIIKIEVVVKPGDKIRIWNYKVWEEY